MLCALCLDACGNTLQDQPIPHNELESLLLAPYPVYWLGGTFHGLQITEASRDPSGAFTVQYGDCLEGGQSTCVPPLKVITSPDNGFVPGEGSGAARASASLRGVRGYLAAAGQADLDRHRRGGPRHLRPDSGARARRGRHGGPDQLSRRARHPAGRALPNTGFGSRPLPSQVPNPLRALG